MKYSSLRLDELGCKGCFALVGGYCLKLGNTIRRFRFEHDEMSQAELANVVGVTRQTILSIEKGRFVPSTLLALKIAKFFDVQVEDIFFLVDE